MAEIPTGPGGVTCVETDRLRELARRLDATRREVAGRTPAGAVATVGDGLTGSRIGASTARLSDHLLQALDRVDHDLDRATVRLGSAALTFDDTEVRSVAGIDAACTPVTGR